MLLPSQRAFVAFAKTVLRDDKIQEAMDCFAAVRQPDTPPFRTSQQEAISGWFQSLSDADKGMVRAALADMADRALHALFHILDNGLGDDVNYGRLELYSSCQDRRKRINPQGSELGNLFHQMITKRIEEGSNEEHGPRERENHSSPPPAPKSPQ